LAIVVLLILAGVWALVLGPGIVKRMLEGRSIDSVGAFHRHLRVLERTGPTVVDPVFRLANSSEPPGRRPAPVPLPRPGLVLIRPDARAPRLGTDGGAVSQRRSDPYFSPGACRRRRDVLLALVSVFLFTGVLGAIPQLRMILAVTAFSAVLVMLYLVVLVRMRTRALERSVKLRYLPSPAPEFPVVVRRSAAR